MKERRKKPKSWAFHAYKQQPTQEESPLYKQLPCETQEKAELLDNKDTKESKLDDISNHNNWYSNLEVEIKTFS